jgi:post-segregation antitoxin (ccd killing protein)
LEDYSGRRAVAEVEVAAVTRANAGVAEDPEARKAVSLAARRAAPRAVPQVSTPAIPGNRGVPRGFLVAEALANRENRVTLEILASREPQVHQVSNASPGNPRVCANGSKELETAFGNGMIREGRRLRRGETRPELESREKTARTVNEHVSLSLSTSVRETTRPSATVVTARRVPRKHHNKKLLKWNASGARRVSVARARQRKLNASGARRVSVARARQRKLNASGARRMSVARARQRKLNVSGARRMSVARARQRKLNVSGARRMSVAHARQRKLNARSARRMSVVRMTPSSRKHLNESDVDGRAGILRKPINDSFRLLLMKLSQRRGQSST